MRALAVLILIGSAASAFAQDPLESLLQAAPRAASLAGSPENLASLVEGLTQGTPVRLVSPGAAGFSRVLTFVPPARVSPAQAVALLEGIRRDFDLLGIAHPTAQQLAAALVGGIVETPAGRTSLGAPRAAVSAALEPAAREQPTPEERAVAALPAEIRAVVADLPAKEALRTVELADQQLIALGTPYAAPERRRQMVQRVRYGAGYVSASAGETTFPPLSPLVAAPLWQP